MSKIVDAGDKHRIERIKCVNRALLTIWCRMGWIARLGNLKEKLTVVLTERIEKMKRILRYSRIRDKMIRIFLIIKQVKRDPGVRGREKDIEGDMK